MPVAGKCLEVAAAVLLKRSRDIGSGRSSIQFLAVRRSAGPMQGYWEFPGGKRNPEETMCDCLAREIQEELGLQIEVGDLLGVNTHSDADKTLQLHAYLVWTWTGEPRLSVHDKLRWLDAEDLDSINWSPADIPFAQALRDKVSNGVLR